MEQKEFMTLEEFFDIFDGILGEKRAEEIARNKVNEENEEDPVLVYKYTKLKNKKARTRYVLSQLVMEEGKKPGSYFASLSDSTFGNFRQGKNMRDFIPAMSRHFERTLFSEFMHSLDLSEEQILYFVEKLHFWRPNITPSSSITDIADETADLFMEVLEKTLESDKKEKQEKKERKRQAKVQAASLQAAYSKGKQNPKQLFPMQAYYLPPMETLKLLQETAFTDSTVHALTGRRGMGKTLLAQYFARSCCLDKTVRKELQYKTVIKLDASDKNLRDAVMAIPCEGKLKADGDYAQQIKLLEKQKKPCLLIIDNYDESKYAEDLSESSQDYLALISTGCHILFTSKLDLGSCHHIRQTTVEPLSQENQFQLFCQVAKNTDPEQDREMIRFLLEECLLGNTYLIVLAAELMETKSLEELIQAFGGLAVGEIGDLISTNKDGRKQQDATLMTHFKIMFDLAEIHADEKKLWFLYNLAMLPLEGMRYDAFMDQAFRPEERSAMQMVYRQLRNSAWILIENRSVRLHPMVRELVLREVARQPFRVVAQLIRNTEEKLRDEAYSDHTVSALNYGLAAYKGCRILGYETFETSCLVSRISSSYDILKRVEHAHTYGVEALAALSAYDNTEDISRQMLLSDCYNVAGYAILHARDQKADATILAKNAFKKALSLLSKALKDPQYKHQAQLLKTRIRGNVAAWHLTRGEYDAALEIHSKEKDFRLRLLKKEPTVQNQYGLSSSYKGMATAYFYLSTTAAAEASTRNLQASLDNHQQATAILESIFTPKNLETATAYNRLVGTGVSLLENLGPELAPEMAEQWIEDYLNKMESVASYLDTIGPVASEVKDCICHTARLAGILDERQIPNRKLKKQAVRIAGIIQRLDEEGIWQEKISTIRNLM